jgi:DNA adenine methylase
MIGGGPALPPLAGPPSSSEKGRNGNAAIRGGGAAAVKEKAARPILRWHGGKWLLAQWIIGFFPSHDVYVEPFGGGASVLLRKPPLAAEIYNDLDGAVVNVFRVMRDPTTAAELQRRLRLTPYARAEFDDAYRPAADDIDAARKTIVLSFMGFGTDSASRSCRTGFRAKLTGERGHPSQSWASYVEALPFFTWRLHGTCIERRDGLDVMRTYDGPRTLFYVDPPYLHATRSSLTDRSAKTHGYRHELDDADHGRLIEALIDLRGFVALSGYRSADYDRLLAGWRRVEASALADGARSRVECLWLNPALVEALPRLFIGELA